MKKHSCSGQRRKEGGIWRNWPLRARTTIAITGLDCPSNHPTAGERTLGGGNLSYPPFLFYPFGPIKKGKRSEKKEKNLTPPISSLFSISLLFLL